MAEFIPAKHDVVFKALFVYHHDILAAFLHDVLDLPITVKSHIDVKNPEIIPVYADGKTCRLDIHVETENRKFNVEMQSRADGFSTERVLYYWSKMFIAELETGEKYELLEQTYSINVLGFNYFDCVEYHSSFSVLEDSRYQKLSDKLSIHIFELPKVPKKIDPNDKKQLWMHLIKANSEEALEMLRATTSDPMIHKAIDAVYALNADAELREKIRQRDKAVRDYANDMAVAKDKGRAEEKVSLATNLIQNGKLSFEEIAGVTGLPLETIQELAKENSTT